MTPFHLVGSFRAQPGQADALTEVLLQAADGLRANDACTLYLVSRDPQDADAVWVTETWTSQEAHAASLDDAATQELITHARPLIAGLGQRFTLEPRGGKGAPA